jgi:hypothetical protein
MQRAKILLFFKLVCFFPFLAGRFHNFELTQNREKTRNGLTLISFFNFHDKEIRNANNALSTY